MKHLPVVFHEDYVIQLPKGHRFPMPKFGIIYELLLKENITSPGMTFSPVAPSHDLLTLGHSKDYIERFEQGELTRQEIRRIGLPWSPELVKRTTIAVGGSVRTALLALEHGIACNAAGGTHHAFRDFGSGFCIYNDVAVTANYLLEHTAVESILIVDLDVHQGDGTASILASEPRAFTFSMHGEKNFPFRKQKSDFDIALENGVGDDEYMRYLQIYLPVLIEDIAPDIILYDAGVDPHEIDPLGKLSLSSKGLYERDLYVIEQAASAGVPLAGVIGGGYSKDLDELADRHVNLHRAAQTVFQTL